MRSRTLKLILLWMAVQWLIGLAPVLLFRQSYIRCQRDASCRSDTALLWDNWRAYVAVMCVQLIQPIASGLLVATVKFGKDRRRHLAKAAGIGVALAVITSILGLTIYQHYPRPQYWSLGNPLLEAYFIFPVFQVLSGVLGGVICGAFDWRSLMKQKSSTL
jgi:hypothetical protein